MVFDSLLFYVESLFNTVLSISQSGVLMFHSVLFCTCLLIHRAQFRELFFTLCFIFPEYKAALYYNERRSQLPGWIQVIHHLINRRKKGSWKTWVLFLVCCWVSFWPWASQLISFPQCPLCRIGMLILPFSEGWTSLVRAWYFENPWQKAQWKCKVLLLLLIKW